MAIRGRPRIEINQQNFESLCGLQCTLEEIAGFFRCSADTIERWCKNTYQENFAEVYKKHSTAGKISLRRHQFKLAEKNAAMAIWLGKQILGQRDVQVIDQSLELKKNPFEGLTEAELKKLAGLNE